MLSIWFIFFAAYYSLINGNYILLGGGECRQSDGQYPLKFSKGYSDLNPHTYGTNAEQARSRCKDLCLQFDWCYAAEVVLRDIWPTPYCRMVTDRPTYERAYGSNQVYTWGHIATIGGQSYQTYCAGGNPECSSSNNLATNWDGGRLNSRAGYECWIKLKLDGEDWTVGTTIRYPNDATDIGEAVFNTLFRISPPYIIRRECPTCADNHKVIYYRRLTPDNTWNAYKNMRSDWYSQNNILNTNFILTNDLAAAIAGNNQFAACNYDDSGIGSFRDCGRTGLIGNQWTSVSRGGHSARFSIYTPKVQPPILEYNFDDLHESISGGDSNYDLILSGQVKIENGELVCDGSGNAVSTGLIDENTKPFNSHSFEVAVKLDDLNQQGAGVIGIDSDYGWSGYIHYRFDSLVFNENNNDKKWISGSEYWARTNTPITNAPQEDSSIINDYVHFVVTYNNDRYVDRYVQLYRNGAKYGDAWTPSGFLINDYRGYKIMFCQRHKDASKDKLRGRILFGAVYDYALSSQQVFELYKNF